MLHKDHSGSSRELNLASNAPASGDESVSRREIVAAVLGALGSAAISGCASKTEVESTETLAHVRDPIVGTSAVGWVDTTMDLKSVTGQGVGETKIATVALLGAGARGDGGGGIFEWIKCSPPTSDDGGTTFLPDTQPSGSDGPGYWKRLNAGVLDARWFGAKGDGSTDDTLALQAMVNAALSATTSGVVQLSPGNYLITGMTLPDGSVLRGAGPRTKLIAKPRSDSNQENVITLGHNCAVQNLAIEGDGGTNGDDFTKNNGIYAAGKTCVIIENCTISKCEAAGIQLRDCANVIVAHNTLHSNQWGGFAAGSDIEVYSAAAGRRLIIEGNLCLSNNSQGISVDGLGTDTDILITNNVCITLDPSTCVEGGPWSEIASGSLARRHGILCGYNNNIVGGPRCIVANNICRNTGWSGIYKIGIPAGSCLISGNLCSCNGIIASSTLSAGIFVQDGGARVTVSNNVIEDFQNNRTSCGAILVRSANADSVGPKIVGNTILGSLGYGVNLSTAVAFVEIADNRFYNNTLTDIYWYAAGGHPNAGGHHIHHNTINRSNINKPAIDLTPSDGTSEIRVEYNTLIGAGTSTVPSVENSAVRWTNNTIRVRMTGNRIENFDYGFSTNAYVSSHTRHGVHFLRNTFKTVHTAYGLASTSQATVIPLVDDLYEAVTAVSDGAALSAYTVGYPCQLEHDRYVIEAVTMAPSVGTWQRGDRCHFSAPAAGGSIGAVCVAGGSPGTWKTYGSIAG